MASDPKVPATATAKIVESLLEEFDCQPVLFIGAGIARRYISSPSWDGFIRLILAEIGKSDADMTYIWQKNEGDLIKIGSEAADLVFEWAWTAGKKKFAADLFDPSLPKSIFIKTMMTEHLETLKGNLIKIKDKHLISEIEAFRLIRPHALITTNYD